MNSGAPEGLAVPTPHVTPMVLLQEISEGSKKKKITKIWLKSKNFCVLCPILIVASWKLKSVSHKKSIIIFYKENYIRNIKLKKIIKIGWKINHTQNNKNMKCTVGPSCFCSGFSTDHSELECTYQFWL